MSDTGEFERHCADVQDYETLPEQLAVTDPETGHPLRDSQELRAVNAKEFTTPPANMVSAST
jgi:hypothetical protein